MMAEKLRVRLFLDAGIGLFILFGLFIFVFFGKTNLAFLGFLLIIIGAFLVAKRISQ